MRIRRLLPVLVVVSLVAVACGSAQDSNASSNSEVPAAASSSNPSEYDPTETGEQLPAGYQQFIRRDAIAPVYEPRFVASEQVRWDDDSLILGVDLEGEARAYPIGFLNRREIVIDMHRGIPTLVSW